MTSFDIAIKLLNLLPRSVGQGWIIDGGCYIGDFTSWAAKQFPQSNILSFEPDPDSFAKAQKNIGSNGRIEIVNAALGASKGEAEFFRGPLSATNSLLPRPADNLRPYYPEQACLEGGMVVNVVTIDEECEMRGIQELELLKLDLQGGELAALRGAKWLLESGLVKVIVVEVVFVKKYQDQPLFWEIWRELEEFGYSFYTLVDVKVGLYHAEPMSPRQQQWNQGDAVFISKALRCALDISSCNN